LKKDKVMDERSFHAAQDFLLAAKTYWGTTLYRALRDEYLSKAGQNTSQHTVANVAELLEGSVLYQYFAWLERHLQRLKYAGRYGVVPYSEAQRDALEEVLQAGSAAAEVADDLDMPDYYTGVDIHQHPGGLWSDELAGFVYEWGARTTVPDAGEGHRDLHDRFTDLVAQRGEPQRVLDMGCGFGKSTAPFAARFPQAKIDAVDLAAPCLELAAHLADQSGADNARYRQMDARATDYEEGSFDLVTSTMLLHELPPKAINGLMDEAFRVLKPGGRMVHLDFYDIPDAFRRFMHYGHGRRNNEPFMQPLASLDLPGLLESKGFAEIAIAPFQETYDVDLSKNDAWRFPWTVIDAVKPGD